MVKRRRVKRTREGRGDDSVSVDEDRHRWPDDAEGLIAARDDRAHWIRMLVLLLEGLNTGVGVLHRGADECNVGMRRGCLAEDRDFFGARAAPRRPEIDDDRLAAQLLDSELGPVQLLDRELGSGM